MPGRCRAVDCPEPVEFVVFFVAASARYFDDEGEEIRNPDRIAFFGCAPHARRVWLQAKRNGASPVWQRRN